ncbi:Sodium-independent sulfate anion transporter [Hypsibius exemplaris]|uniref:Sodium-independent sulfate anion transporter n=1 Tax=Hypsibius exemplaris TaxID=2072580 RepID=A0A1W0X180_HYPEX|nr:Sodium-independent sulfate anion transporter [Hypsibius exemplaris]
MITNGKAAEHKSLVEPTETTPALGNHDGGVANDSAEEEWVLCAEASETTYVGQKTGFDANWLSGKNIRRVVARSCSVSKLKQRLPITLWLPKYSWQDLRGDCIAGVTVGMTSVPQALAYAQIADLPLEYGLYSSFMGCFVYTLFGTSKDVTLGVTAVISLLTSACIPKEADMLDRTRYAVLLAFLVGLFQTILGVFHLGFLFNFISHPVLSGFTTASGFIIMFSQIKNILGVKGGLATDSVIQQATGYMRNIGKVRGWDVLLGMICISVLLLMREIRVSNKSKLPAPLREAIRIFAAARYGVVVIFATLIGFLLHYYNISALSLTAQANTALPAVTFPEFTWNNQSFFDHLTSLSPGIPFIVMVSSIETIAIAKAFGTRYQYTIDPSQELIAIGLGNFLTSFVSGYSIAGSFTKSSLNAQSGVRTPMGCVFTGLFVVTAQATISHCFQFVPKAALGAVIVVAVLMLIDLKIFKELWVTRPSELIPLIGTILSSMFLGVDIGFLVGIGLSLGLVLLSLAKPRLKLEKQEAFYVSRHNPAAAKNVVEIRVVPDGEIFMAAAEPFKHFLTEKLFRSRVVEQTRPDSGLGHDIHDESPDLFYRKYSVGGTINSGHLNLIQDNSLIAAASGIRQMYSECVLVLHGEDLRKLDFTTLTELHSVVDQFGSNGHAIKFVEVPVRLLRLLLPNTIRTSHLSKADKPNDLRSLTVKPSPASWRSRGGRASIHVTPGAILDSITGESSEDGDHIRDVALRLD